MRLKTRIYRTHDYDLMLMHYGKMLSIRDDQGREKHITVSRAIGLALEAYYSGEPLTINVNRTDVKLPEKMSGKFTFTVYVYDRECPGIESWLAGMAGGNRNNLIKLIVRSYCDQIPVWGFGGSIKADSDGIINKKKAGADHIKESEKTVRKDNGGMTAHSQIVNEDTDNAPEPEDEEEFDPMAMLQRAHK